MSGKLPANDVSSRPKPNTMDPSTPRRKSNVPKKEKRDRVATLERRLLAEELALAEREQLSKSWIFYEFLYRALFETRFFAHAGWILLLLVYTIIGACLFAAIEGHRHQRNMLEEFHRQEARHERHNKSQTQLIADFLRIWHVRQRDYTLLKKREMLRLTLEAIKNYDRTNGLVHRKPVANWTRWDHVPGAVHYAFSLYTTIGYGDLRPSTFAGRTLTLIYSIFGIILLFCLLADLSSLLHGLFDMLWRHCAETFARKLQKSPTKRQQFRRFGSEVSLRSLKANSIHRTLSERTNTSESIRTYDSIGFGSRRSPIDEYRELDERSLLSLPLAVALTLLIGWMLFCSAIIRATRSDLDYFGALYFYTTSIMTIGLGDVLPFASTPHNQFQRFGILLIHVISVLLGLCLIGLLVRVAEARAALSFDRLEALILTEYRLRLTEPELSILSDEEPPSVGLRALRRARMSLGQRLIFHWWMGDHRRAMLRKLWDHRATMVNEQTQTTPMVRDMMVQTGMKLEEQKQYDVSEESEATEDSDEEGTSRSASATVDTDAVSVRSKKTAVISPKRYIYYIYD